MQPTAWMDLPCIACVTLLLNLTMTSPLAQFHSCMNPMIDNMRTSNLPSMQLSCRDDSACLAMPCLYEILRCSGKRTLGMNRPLM